MATTDKYLTYHGDLKAVAPVGPAVLFVTAHPEGQPTALYRLDAAKLALAADPLPAGGNDLVTDGETVWVAGTDRRVYRGPAAGGKLTALKVELDAPPTRLALLSGGRLAALAGERVVVLSAKDGKFLQSLDLPEPGTALAADPTGNWLVAGTSKGTVLVFDAENRDAFLLSESAKLHEGAVTALLFEPDDLRFLSAGADGRLLTTHARGKLEPEDKGRGNNHSDVVTSLVWAPGDRFLSGGRDSTVKSWPRVGGVKPATTKDGLAKVLALCVVQVGTRTQLVAACDGNTLRLFPLDAAGKMGELAARAHGANDWAKHELAAGDVKARESTLRQLAEWNDTPAVELIAQQVQTDADHGLRLLGTQLLASSSHPRAVQLLEKPLTHNDEAVRTAAFAGLRKLRGDQDLRPLDLALQAGKADVGRLAVEALEKLAAKDDQALARLTKALDRDPPEVRQAALASLEAVHGGKSPEASLVALGTKHPDLRRLALVRLHQRGLLADARVQTALRRAGEDADAEVRRAAFLLSLYTRDKLAPALRGRDPELDRQLAELETSGKESAPAAKRQAAEATAPETAPPEASPSKTSARSRPPLASSRQKGATDADLRLDPGDYDPLLQATASRALDTCLRGARGLAVLGDERALGLLLQLSRERDASARTEVARALAALDDPRSAGRLRSLLFDEDAAVRDAAFSALAKLSADNPLAAADAGLGAQHEDVRRRGLQAVIAAARQRLPQSADEPAWPLLIRALNDPAAAVRTEAFKAALNLKVAGGGANTLRFVLQSVHPDVRREVLTEAMAQTPTGGATGTGGQPWAWALLLDFLNDPDPGLRGEAFDFATKRTKDLGPLEAALAGRHPDVRQRAVDALIKRHSKAAQALLAKALADADRKVRSTAIDALVGDDVRDALRDALRSPHDDVHARAARALARHGDPAALKPLADLATAPEPVDQPAERRAAWAALVETALEGLAELGDPAALPHVLPLLDSPHANVRKAAAQALTWVALAHHPGSLRQAMQHADPKVKYRAALGLALGGEASAAPLVFGPEAAKVLGSKDRLAAAVALGPAGEDALAVSLDSENERTRTHAVLLLMLLELKASGGVPTRCLTCLASRDPRVRLRAARGLDTFRDPGLFLQFVTRLFTDRGGDEKPWTIKPETVDAVADLVAFGPPAVRARVSRLLTRLFKDEQAAWDRAWAVHAERFAPELAAVRKDAANRSAAAGADAGPRYTPEQLEELAFGAYVGLVREQGASAGKGGSGLDSQAVGRVRQTALTWLQELAKRNARYAQPAQAVFVQALGDPHQDVRTQAFDQLRELKTDPTALGAEALAAGHTDLGVRGLELLSGAGGGKTSAAGQAVLEQSMLARTDDLSTEAAKLLAGVRGMPAVAAAALAAAHEPLRLQAVAWLAAEYDKSADAKKHLRAALYSRYFRVREAAAHELATKRDPTAFDALVRLLADAADATKQRQAIAALERLGDTRTPDALLDRLEKDPAGTAQADDLIAAAGKFRQPKTVDRLLAVMDRDPKRRTAAFRAALVVSGYDQPIEDPEDERPDRAWEQKQHPRHDGVLARLIERCLSLNEAKLLSQMIGGVRFPAVNAARWARGKELDAALAPLARHPDEALRRAAVEAYAWRVRKRKAPADPLLAALSHRDPTTQFLAAEGLARAGRGEGLSVLLSAVDFLQDVALRRRAVEAMGALGDARALDPLLKIATEDDHVLQDAAAEALGRLGRSPAAGEVFKLLERLAKAANPRTQPSAYRGLRWLDTPDAWRLLRTAAADEDADSREVAIEQLAHDDDPATRDLLLKLLATDEDADVARGALAAARKLFGEASLEPHYAWIQNPSAEDAADGESVRLLADRGDIARVFQVLPKVAAKHQDAIATRLLNRTPQPVAEAAAALPAAEAGTVRVAARILGRAGPSAAAAAKGAKVGPALAAAIERWQKTWDEKRAKLGTTYGVEEELDETLTPTLRTLAWAAGRLGVAPDTLVAAAGSHAGDPHYRPIRLEAVSALSLGELKGATLSAMESAAVGDDPEVRALAADALATQQPKRAAALADKVLADRVSFNRMAMDLTAAGSKDGDGLRPALRSAAGHGHYQGIALPHLVSAADLATLSAVADDRMLPEATRLGAVEGLGRLAAEPAEAKLRAIGANDKEEEAVRKAAWRALRRSKRARTAGGATAAVT